MPVGWTRLLRWNSSQINVCIQPEMSTTVYRSILRRFGLRNILVYYEFGRGSLKGCEISSHWHFVPFILQFCLEAGAKYWQWGYYHLCQNLSTLESISLHLSTHLIMQITWVKTRIMPCVNWLFFHSDIREIT